MERRALSPVQRQPLKGQLKSSDCGIAKAMP
jgi:hypothetical protein